MVFKNICIFVLRTKEASALEGLLTLSPLLVKRVLPEIVAWFKLLLEKKSYPMNTNMARFRCFSEIFASLPFGGK